MALANAPPWDPLSSPRRACWLALGRSGSNRKITLYSNGFTVDGGPFRALADPANRAFVESMNKGEIPAELQQGSEEVHVDLENKTTEEYVPPPPPAYVAFSDGGAQATGSSAAMEGALAGGEGAAAAAEVPVVDESKPKTTVAVRLISGKRMRCVVNLDHTVAHLHALIAHEGAASEPYVLLGGFPPAQITDAGATIEAAGLKGAQVTQKKA